MAEGTGAPGADSSDVPGQVGFRPGRQPGAAIGGNGPS